MMSCSTAVSMNASPSKIFVSFYLNCRIPVPQGGGKTVLKPVADVWLHHPKRRQFVGGVIFDPSGHHARPDMLNLWQGFAVEPRPGSWARLQDHILKIVCAGDTSLRDWLMGWMARLVQRPGEQGEVAVVMRGIEGCGKGTIGEGVTPYSSANTAWLSATPNI